MFYFRRPRLAGALLSVSLIAINTHAADTAPAAAAELPPVVVSAPKLTVERRIDRTVYAVENDVQSTTGTLSDILTAIPSLDVDADGALSLRGDTHVLILVDGKPSALFSGSSAGENLQSIPAKDIVRVEVMSNPPPQYKAEGVAGVINIVTRRTKSSTLAGSVQASLGSEGRYELGSSLNDGFGALSASLSATLRHDLRALRQSSDLIAPDASTGVITDNHNSLDQLMRRTSPPIDLLLAYAFNERQDLSLDVNRTGRGGLRTYTELTTAVTPPQDLTKSSQRLSFGHDHEVDYDDKLVFTQKFARAGEELDATLHRSTSENKEQYDYTNLSVVPPAATFYSDLGFREDNTTSEADLDYSLPLSQTRTVKLGYGFEQDRYGYAASGGSLDAPGGVQTVDPNLVDDFDYVQRIHSVYASYEAARGAWSSLVGARAELTATDGRQLGQGVSTEYRYARLYPNLHLERRLSEQSKLIFGLSRRVTRPQAENLNPYVDQEFTPNLRAGNAYLRPQYTQLLEAGFDRETHGSAQSASVYYRRNSGTVSDLVEDLGNGVSLTTKTNLPRDQAVGVEFSASSQLTRMLSAALSGNLFRRQIDATALGVPGLQSTTGFSGKLKVDFHPTSADSAQLLISRTGKVLTPQGYLDAIDIVNAGYRRVVSSSLTATLTVSDLFNGQRQRRIAVTPLFTDRYERDAAGRIVWVGFVYSFGATKAESSKFQYDE